MFQDIPKKRLLTYLLVLGLIPFCFSLLYLFSVIGEIHAVKNQLFFMEESLIFQQTKQSSNRSLISRYKNADRFFIDNQLEPLTFLKDQQKSLEDIINSPYFTGDETTKKRFDLLSGKENKLLFNETNPQNYPWMKEIIEVLAKPVEVDTNDLFTVLSIIEGPPIGIKETTNNPPQLLILDLSLNRKPIGDKNEVFLLNLKLLKREFL